MFVPGVPVESQGCARGKVDPDIFFEEDSHDLAAHVCLSHCPARIRAACRRHAEDTIRVHGYEVDTVQAGLLWPSTGHKDQRPRKIAPAPKDRCLTCAPPEVVAMSKTMNHPTNWPYRLCRACGLRVRANPDTLLIGLHVDGLKVCPGSNQPPVRLSGLGNKSCKNGHEYTPENTATTKDGRRECLTCRRRAQGLSRKRRKQGLATGKSTGKRSTACRRGHPRKPDDPATCRRCRSLSRRAFRAGLSVDDYIEKIGGDDTLFLDSDNRPRGKNDAATVHQSDQGGQSQG